MLRVGAEQDALVLSSSRWPQMLMDMLLHELLGKRTVRIPSCGLLLLAPLFFQLTWVGTYRRGFHRLARLRTSL